MSSLPTMLIERLDCRSKHTLILFWVTNFNMRTWPPKSCYTAVYLSIAVLPLAGPQVVDIKRSHWRCSGTRYHFSCLIFRSTGISVADPNPDPDPLDPHVFGPPGSGSTSQRYGSGSGSCSGSGSVYHHAKIVRKTLIPTTLWLFWLFIFEKWCKCSFKK
jgi:hypothetical protein